jgi:hypothetical protein
MVLDGASGVDVVEDNNLNRDVATAIGSENSRARTD